jgi:hypothetical protein
MQITVNEDGELEMKGVFAMVYHQIHRGKVVALGTLKYCNCEHPNRCSECDRKKGYIVVHLDEGGLLFHVLNEAVVVNDIGVGDHCVLNIKSNEKAAWELIGTTESYVQET